jgi:toxin HigB-1
MIRSFADRRTEDFWVTARTRWLSPDVRARAVRKLQMIDAAHMLDDLRLPAGNRLHRLSGDRQGQHAVAIDRQWRVCFRFDAGAAYDVEICDYH